ncbi:MAG: DUF1631 family protein, partial [Rubrivivax sp.]
MNAPRCGRSWAGDELSRSIGSELRATYADIVSRLRSAGVQPLSLAAAQRQQRVPGSSPGAAAWGRRWRAPTSPPRSTSRPLDLALGDFGGGGGIGPVYDTHHGGAMGGMGGVGYRGGGGMPYGGPVHAAAYAGGYAGRGGGAAGAGGARAMADMPPMPAAACAAARATVATVVPPVRRPGCRLRRRWCPAGYGRRRTRHGQPRGRTRQRPRWPWRRRRDGRRGAAAAVRRLRRARRPRRARLRRHHRHGHHRSGYGSTSGYSTGSTGSGFGRSTRGGATLGTVDATMMALMRRLAVSTQPAFGGGNATGYDTSPQGLGPIAPNIIRAHRHELREASKGALDHLVIDVIGSLFDAILADPKVPPQLARQIARLQLPVLRAALGDASFFASRKHPVRRFINRIASLGAAFDDFSESEARDFLAKVRDLVQDVVEGDFEQIDIYESKLQALEEFAAELASRNAAAHGAAPALLAAKEDEAQLTELYARQIEMDLKGLAAPEFIVHFMSQVWSRVLLRTALAHGGDSAEMKRARQAGLDLVLSVQPKPTPAHRKSFLTGLPNMMQALNLGLNLIGWPEGERRAFFGQLMPAHAEALKAPSARMLDINLMAKQVDGALAKPVPSRETLGAPGMQLPVLSEEIVLPRISADEARRIGLVDEASIDWNGQVDIDVAAFAEERQAQLEAELAAQPI